MRDLVTLPKAHLHVHLESSVRWQTLQEMASDHGRQVPAGPSESFVGFRDFADQNALVRQCLRRPEDFARVAYEFCEDEAAQGTRYVEVTFTAAAHGERLNHPEMPLEAVLDGLARGGTAFGLQTRVILDHSRRRSVERAWQTLRLATRYADSGVVGIGMAGEETYPLGPFAQVCTAAVAAGVHLTHHAGEGAGPDSIREALVLGRAERLGHGVRVLEDDDLVAEIRELGVPLEVCPSSNVALGVVPSLAAHPFPQLVDAGLTVTINTDIPAVVGTSLAEEYRLVRDAFHYDDAVIAELARAAVQASFAPIATKSLLNQGITAWLENHPLPVDAG